MAYGLPPISFIGYPVSILCPGHAGLGLREVHAADAPGIVDHLAALSPEDRHLRFCGTLSDAAIAEHVAGLDRRPGFALAAFAGPLWQGPFHGSGPIKAFAELVVSGQTAELGLSVDADRRRAGIGTYLIQTAARLLAPRRVARILALTLARNTAMIRLGEACGAGIERDGADVMIDFSVAQLDAAYRARRTAQILPWTRRLPPAALSVPQYRARS
jgi:GNAT superfamily N-acetyltransferase